MSKSMIDRCKGFAARPLGTTFPPLRYVASDAIRLEYNGLRRGVRLTFARQTTNQPNFWLESLYCFLREGYAVGQVCSSAPAHVD